MERFLKIALLGLAHGLSDCAAGFMIGTMPIWTGEGWLEPSMLVLLYNALAFGGQVPAGLIVDRIGNPKLVVAASLALVALALAIFPMAPGIAIAFAGVAGAFFHVSGGMLALRAFPGSTIGAGLFAAPGVLGITLGAYMAWAQIPALWALAISAFGITTVIFLLRMPFADSPKPTEKDEAFEWHDFLMIVLLMAIALRSAIWNLMETVHNGNHELLLWMGAAAMAGKVAGGFGAHYIGWRRYATAALMVAAPLLTFGGSQEWALLSGIFLLQSATPAAVLGMWRLMPRLPATAIGMTFGLAIAVGGIPMMVGWEPPGWAILLILPIAGIGYWVALGVKKLT
jgi:FSR family fosmidomycin resistance protein-like MFS transporter